MVDKKVVMMVVMSAV